MTAGLQTTIGFGLQSTTKTLKIGSQTAMRLQSVMNYKVIQYAMATKSKMVKAYEKELPPAMVT